MDLLFMSVTVGSGVKGVAKKGLIRSQVLQTRRFVLWDTPTRYEHACPMHYSLGSIVEDI